MFVMTSVLGSFTWLRDDVMTKLKATYEATVEKQNIAVRAAYAEIDTYLKSEVDRAKGSTQQGKKPDDPSPPPAPGDGREAGPIPPSPKSDLTTPPALQGYDGPS